MVALAGSATTTTRDQLLFADRDLFLAAIQRLGNKVACSDLTEGRGRSLSRREQIISRIPSADDLDLIVIDPPVEWK